MVGQDAGHLGPSACCTSWPGGTLWVAWPRLRLPLLPAPGLCFPVLGLAPFPGSPPWCPMGRTGPLKAMCAELSPLTPAGGVALSGCCFKADNGPWVYSL